ncbi:Urb2/Npa2 family-domain-containing protein [Lobosporangium transversale]|uniref:Urb2/Npa2 family-domain-containing protein n=1 Tax=Lobosporangium transversale TaxID=64571 RepID=A0A1Y2GA86_9FUNG|nr:Urb2/Npa2 family-domain-containing protein [Lobosporangium transversale]ORZ05335.1 Urb2/Npa2 family-domain-containing protein [Lobosporangium transversale]|eukprot:XP_021877027.1 Urb2/Npa2 family-domain-containing protein [Lobosporangium transversale]
MEEHLSSSELFAKALKGYQTSSAEKIWLAKQAWQRSDVVLPHKHEFLFEWLCSTLVKASAATKSAKDASPTILLEQDYWDLFKAMLTQLTHSRRDSSKYGHINIRHHEGVARSGSDAVDLQALGVLIRVPVISIFTTLIQNLVSYQPATTVAQSKVSGKKAKALTALTMAQDPSTYSPSKEILESASTCFELLTLPLMSDWFQPTLEQYTPLIQAILEALVEMVQETSKIDTAKYSTIMRFAFIVLDQFKRLIIIQPNQKKVFALVAAKMFEMLVRARVAVRKVPGLSSAECQEAIDAILRTGLFHQDHLQEYTAGYTGRDEKSIQSYQKQLFEQIATLIRSEYSTAVLDILPVFLHYFVEESRRRQRSLAISGLDRSLDSTRETEFAFFKIIYVMAGKQLPNLTEVPSEAFINEMTSIIDTHNNLLATVLELDMYQPSNDKTADQFVFMNTSFESIYSCLATAQTLENAKLQSISLTGIIVLAQLDDRLLKPHLDSLWPVLFAPILGAQEAALELAKALLEIYGKASDLKIFFNSLFSSLRNHLTQPEHLKTSPLFLKPFLDLVPANIRNYMPLPQAPSISSIFITELVNLQSNTGIEELMSLQEMGVKKKRKLKSGKAVEQGERSRNIASAEQICELFIQFLKGLRVTANQEKQLSQGFKDLYEHFLKHIFKPLVNEDSDRSESYQSRRLIPALKLHYTLCRISTQYWLGGISTRMISDIIKSIKGSSGWSDATILVLNRVVLQHVHMTLCSSEIMTDDIMQQCNDLVRFTMSSSRLHQILDNVSLMTEPWDGEIGSATGSRFLVASWQVQVNDWLDIVCRFGTTQHLELIAQAIVQQFGTSVDNSMAPMTDSITIHILNQILLRSANFYEVPNFRPVFAQMILKRLAESIIVLSESNLERELADMVLSLTESTHSSSKDTGLKVMFVDVLKKLANVIQERSEDKIHHLKSKSKSKSKSMPKSGSSNTKPELSAQDEHSQKLLSLLSIVHLLPLEYFEKNERNIILTTMTILDHYIQTHLTATSTGIKSLLLVRRISDAIMTWRSDAGALFHDPAILLNIVNYPEWNCSTSYGSEDKDGLGYVLMETTAAIVSNTIRFFMAQTHDAIQHESALMHLDALLNLAQEWASSDFKISKATLDRRITESRIRVIMVSQICKSLVQSLGQQRHQKSKSKLKSRVLLGSEVSKMKTEDALLLKRIGSLFETMQISISNRIGEVIESIHSSSTQSGSEAEAALVAGAQHCIDHLELYSTIVQYYQVVNYSQEDKIKFLDMMPDLFRLAGVLLQSITNVEQNDTRDSLACNSFNSISHLVAILTVYSCQYLPLSSSWQSTKETEKLLKGLMKLLLDISGRDLAESDISWLKEAYLAMLGLLSEDQFDCILHWLLEEARVFGDQSMNEVVLIRYLKVTFSNAHHTHKRKVRRQISRLLTRLIQILQNTQSVEVVIGVLDIMAGICSEPAFELRCWEIGLVLEGITSLMSPATPLLLLGTERSNTGSTTHSVLTNGDTCKIFTALYHVLMNIARFRQEELTALIPVFTVIVQGILHGFKSLNGSIAKQQQGVESLVKSPFKLLSAGVLNPESITGSSDISTMTSSSLHSPSSSSLLSLPSPGLVTFTSATDSISIGDPLSVECAENFARLLTALGTKNVHPLGSYGNNDGGGNDSTMDALQISQSSSSIGSSTGSTSSAIAADTSKAFGKHAPYILMEYFHIQSSIVASISQQSLRNALLPGLYALLSLCSDWEREMMMTGLDNTGKTLLKGLYTDYLRYYKYTGR